MIIRSYVCIKILYLWIKTCIIIVDHTSCNDGFFHQQEVFLWRKLIYGTTSYVF